jgi:predicted phage terminase large subunit-like protein
MGWAKWSRQFAPKNVEKTTVETFGSQVSYVAYVNTVNDRFRWYRHNEELAKVAQGIADGLYPRVIICIPPGMSKSETISRLLSAYYLDRFPQREVGLVCVTADLAEDLAGDAREYFVAGGGKLDPSTTAKNNWRTLQGGRMWAKGFGGTVRGFRFDLGIIDDPHKGPEDLESEVQRTKFYRWYQRTFLGRQNMYTNKRGASIVIVSQRLAPNDLIGWILEQPDAEKWLVVCLDAVRSEEPWQSLDARGKDLGPIPTRCTVWPDWRKPEELLAEELLTKERLAELRSDPEAYDAQYQQRPKPVAGEIFNPNWFKRVHPDDIPVMLRRVMGVDLALTEKETADFTVGFPLGFGLNGNYYFFRPYRAQAESPVTEVEIPARARAMKCQTIGAEAVAYQSSFVQHLRKDIKLAGIPVVKVQADRDKVARARGWSSLAEQGRVYLVEDPKHMDATGEDWIEEFLFEIQHFPRKRKDQVDAAGIAIEVLRRVSGDSTARTGGKHPGNGYQAA